MAIILPKRESGTGRRRQVTKRVTGGDVEQIAVRSDPGVRAVSGAFGGLEAEALQGLGGTISKIGKEQAIVEKANAKVEDESNLAQGKIAVDELIRADQNRVRTTGFRDEEGNEVDQSKLAREEFINFKNNVLDKRFIGKFTDPGKEAELNNYFIKQSSIHEDFIQDDRFIKKDDENETTVSKLVTDLKNFKVQNPGIGDSPPLRKEFNSRVKTIEDFQKARVRAGMLSQNEFQNWKVNTADALGQIAVDQEISKIENLGDPSGAQDLIDDLGKGKFGLKPETVQSQITKVFSEFSKFFDKKQKADAKLQKENQNILVSDFMRRSEDFGLQPGEEPASEEEFLRLTSDRVVTKVVDGKVVKTTLPPLITNPAQVARMQKILSDGKNKDGDLIADESILIAKNRTVREGQTDEQAIEEQKEQINEQHRLGNVTNEATSEVVDELARWSKEVSTESGKKVSEDKRTLTAAIKAELPMTTGFMAKFLSKNDLKKKKLIQDMTRIAHARLEQAEVNRKAGKPFETAPEIWGDMRTRVDQKKILLVFPNETRELIGQAMLDIQAGKLISAVRAEQILLLTRQDFESAQKNRESNAGN